MYTILYLLAALAMLFCCRRYLQPLKQAYRRGDDTKQGKAEVRKLTPLDFDKIIPCREDPTRDVPAYSRSWKGARYLMTMGIRKLDVNDWLIFDDLYPAEHRDKVKRLNSEAERPILFQHLDGTYEACKEGLEVIVRYLTTRYPTMFVVDGEYVVNKCLGEQYRFQEPMDMHPLEVASLLVYEDVHILQEGQDQLYSLSVTFHPASQQLY